MTSISARIPDSLEEQLEIFINEEKLDRSTAVRKLLSEGLDEWNRERALKMLERGETTLSRATEMAEMDVLSFADLVKKRDVNWVKEGKVREDLEDV